MLAFEIEIDGEKAFLAGVEDWQLLSFHLDAMRKADSPSSDEYEIDLFMGGSTVTDEKGISHHVRWGERRYLDFGSVVTIRTVETDSPDPLTRRFRSDLEDQDYLTPEEMRQLRYETYLAYKAEFEPDI